MTDTTTITTIMLLAIGILPLCLATNQNGGNLYHITNCCDLGYGRFTFTFSRNPNPPRVYVLSNFCGHDDVRAEAYCDTTNEGGGWLVVQRRQDGSVDFNRNWVEYENGFGNLNGEFWYGLRALHCLTGQGGWEMRMEIGLSDGTKLFYQYKNFTVASAEEKYQLTIGGFQGNANDPMAYHNGMYFSTKDRDNDRSSKYHCALSWGSKTPLGGWWYNACWHVTPNILSGRGAIYLHNQFVYLAFTRTEIKIRPFRCNVNN